MRKYLRILFSIGAIALPAGLAQAQELAATAEVSPETVMVGESAQYMIRFAGTTQVPNLLAPRVDGLNFSDRMGTSTFQQIINGRVSIETRAMWNFSPVRTGSFTIPGRTIRISGNEVDIPPVTLQAVPMDEESRSRALLKLEIPEGPYYVGQAIPARLGLFVRDDIGLSNIALPEISGDTFIHTELDRNPPRSRSRVNGRIYDTFVWDFILTPIKTGPAEFRFTEQVEMQIPTRDSRMPSIFNMRSMRSEVVTLSTDRVQTEVIPLPADDQPESFNGAIGEFTVTASLSSRELMVGEPITLTLSISGQGNFDRISPPDLGEWDNWRVYPPKVDFTPEDEAGFRGVKTFEYILIPQSEAVEAVPGMRYATFDPASKVYETTVMDPEPVSVSPSDKPVPQDLFARESREEEPMERIPENLLPIRPEPGSLQDGGAPWQRNAFWVSNLAAALLLLLSAGFLRRRKRLRSDSRLAQRHFGNRKIRKALESARQSAKNGEAIAFFASARYAIQERVSHLSKTPVDSKTLVTSDCLSILHKTKLPETTIQTCAQLLTAADACQFAGTVPRPEELQRLADDLMNVITELNRIQK